MGGSRSVLFLKGGRGVWPKEGGVENLFRKKNAKDKKETTV
jgi:hypothetical protein